MAREGSKRQVAIDVMNSNSDKSMADVIALISAAVGIPPQAARGYYTYLVKQGMAKGKIEATVRAPKTAKEKAATRMVKEVKAKVAKPAKTKAAALAKLENAKSPAEIEKIKAANMARMKAVLAKTKQTVKTEDAPAFAETDEFAAPVFLTKDEVAALV